MKLTLDSIGTHCTTLYSHLSRLLFRLPPRSRSPLSGDSSDGGVLSWLPPLSGDDNVDVVAADGEDVWALINCCWLVDPTDGDGNTRAPPRYRKGAACTAAACWWLELWTWDRKRRTFSTIPSSGASTTGFRLTLLGNGSICWKGFASIRSGWGGCNGFEKECVGGFALVSFGGGCIPYVSGLFSTLLIAFCNEDINTGVWLYDVMMEFNCDVILWCIEANCGGIGGSPSEVAEVWVAELASVVDATVLACTDEEEAVWRREELSSLVDLDWLDDTVFGLCFGLRLLYWLSSLRNDFGRDTRRWERWVHHWATSDTTMYVRHISCFSYLIHKDISAWFVSFQLMKSPSAKEFKVEARYQFRWGHLRRRRTVHIALVQQHKISPIQSSNKGLKDTRRTKVLWQSIFLKCSLVHYLKAIACG